jgi:Cdc6-like AAA superfamily ATPase
MTMATREDFSLGSDSAAEIPYVNETPTLYAALEEFDRFLAAALQRAAEAYGPRAALDGLRGLHLSREDIERALIRAAGLPSLSTPAAKLCEVLRADTRVAWLINAHGLSDFEAALLLIALAPEIDRRYERIYAYLQDDITKTRPTVDLVLNLLCDSQADRLSHRASLISDSALISQRLIELGGPSTSALLAREVRIDEQITRLILGGDGLDSRLVGWCHMHAASPPRSSGSAMAESLARFAGREESVRLYFEGPHGSGKFHTAQEMARELGASLLVADLRGARASANGFNEAAEILARESWLQHAVLYVHGLASFAADTTRDVEQRNEVRALFSALTRYPGIAVIAATEPFRHSLPDPAGCCRIRFDVPDFNARRAYWSEQLAKYRVELEAPEIDRLSRIFVLSYDQIGEIAATGCMQVRRARSADALNGESAPTLDDLCAAARAQCGHELTAMARRIEPRASWSEIVLPVDAIAQLREICQRVVHADRVLGDWGFGGKLTLGKGVNALFAGPSGTGKTLAAEIVAHELGFDLYKIDLSGIVSKYIGETERNLDRVFRAAHRANAVLFFDEADALFGKRSEVRDSHDRYANVEISYLLQKMEEFEGIAILATNLRQNLDDAFTRRLAFTIHFPFPEEKDRLDIWRSIFPPQVPLGDDVDLGALAREFNLSGGNIKNTALAAAYIAAANGGVVTQEHLLHATRREFQKMGKHLSNAQLQKRL